MLNFVIIPFHDYKKWKAEGFRTRDAHVCEHLSKSNEVGKILVINRPTSLAEMILKRDSWKTFGGEVVYTSRNVQLMKMDENIWCLDIFLLDFIKVLLQKKTWWFTAFNYDCVHTAINEAIQYLGMDNSILLLQNPMAIGASENLKCQSFVFDAIDNWLYHPQMPDKELIKKNYQYVEKNADLIMTVSQALTELFPENNNVHWVPNGVDIDYFKDAISDMNADQKVVGYVGKIQDRVNFDLVEECLVRFPNTAFTFLGPAYSQKKRIEELKQKYHNIQFKGDIHYTKLPSEMHSFDVAIIPHTVDNFTNSMNPLKLYEYLAAGKPVVSTGVAGTESISPYVSIAENENEFMLCLDEIITNKRVIDSKAVVESVPTECTWASRTKEMLSLFRQL